MSWPLDPRSRREPAARRLPSDPRRRASDAPSLPPDPRARSRVPIDPRYANQPSTRAPADPRLRVQRPPPIRVDPRTVAPQGPRLPTDPRARPRVPIDPRYANHPPPGFQYNIGARPFGRPGRPLEADRRSRRDSEGVEGNARLTGTTAAVLFVLLAAEGFTILQIRPMLSAHVFIGMLLVPPVLLKMGSTMWRFGRYYMGAPEYRRKGPPPPLLRLLGPVVVILTVLVFASGILLLLGPLSMRSQFLFLHKASFVLWLGAMAVHVLGHFLDTARLAPRDLYYRTRRQVRGAGARQWTVAGSVVLGLLLAIVVVPYVGSWVFVGKVG